MFLLDDQHYITSYSYFLRTTHYNNCTQLVFKYLSGFFLSVSVSQSSKRDVQVYNVIMPAILPRDSSINSVNIKNQSYNNLYNDKNKRTINVIVIHSGRTSVMIEIIT